MGNRNIKLFIWNRKEPLNPIVPMWNIVKWRWRRLGTGKQIHTICQYFQNITFRNMRYSKTLLVSVKSPETKWLIWSYKADMVYMYPRNILKDTYKEALPKSGNEVIWTDNVHLICEGGTVVSKCFSDFWWVWSACALHFRGYDWGLCTWRGEFSRNWMFIF